MARIGLRMMPTFPSPSLECRTVGFPSTATRPVYQTGPSLATQTAVSRGLRPSFVLSAVIVVSLVLCRGDAARLSTTVQAAYTALPQGPSLQPGFALQVFIAYLAPSAPLAISLHFPCLAGYMWRLCCAATLHHARPKLMTSGSRLSIANLS
jgi:hypothetical protein